MKNNYIAKKYWNFNLSPLSKTESMAKKYDDVINLSIGNPDYPADKELVKAMFENVISNDLTKYTGFFGDSELLAETRKFYHDAYNFKIEPNELLITAGGTNAMHIIFEALLDQGDEVILVTPYYPDYIGQVKMAGGQAVIYHTNPNQNFDIDIDELEKCVTNRTKLIIINSPNNPSGKVYCKESIKAVYKLAEKRDFLMIADDIYSALNYTTNREPICTLEKTPDRIITIYSYSKDYSIPGFRIGHIVAREELIDIFCSVAENINFTVNSASQRLALHALKMRERILPQLIDEYKKRVLYCYERIKTIPRMHCQKPEGTFYLFVDISETGFTSFEIWEALLDKAHIVILPGAAFGDSCDGYIRIACTVNIDILKIVFDRLESIDIFSK